MPGFLHLSFVPSSPVLPLQSPQQPKNLMYPLMFNVRNKLVSMYALDAVVIL